MSEKHTWHIPTSRESTHGIFQQVGKAHMALSLTHLFELLCELLRHVERYENASVSYDNALMRYDITSRRNLILAAPPVMLCDMTAKMSVHSA